MSAEIDKIIDEVNKVAQKLNPNRKKPGVFKGSDTQYMDIDFIPTGIDPIDRDILHGGVRKGSITVFTGKAGTGKTTTAAFIIGNVHKKDSEAHCVWVLGEPPFPIDAAQLAGMDMDRTHILTGFSNAEEQFDMLFKFLFDKSKMVTRDIVPVVVIDSIASLSPKAEMDGTMEEGLAKNDMALKARMMSKLNRILRVIQGKTAIIMINQLRSNLGAYGTPDTQPGGNAMMFDPKAILDFRIADLIREGGKASGKVIGHTIKVVAKKNNAGLGGHMYEETLYDVIYNKGVDAFGPMVEAAITQGFIQVPNNGSFLFDLPEDDMKSLGLWKEDKKGNGEPAKIRGKDNLKAFIRSNQFLLNTIAEKIGMDEPLTAIIEEQEEDNEQEE